MKLNYSTVLLSYQEAVYGFVGDNYQRLYIHYDSIFPKDSSYLHYMVWGKTKIKDKISVFSGKLQIKQILKIIKENITDNNIQDVENQERHSNVKYEIVSEIKLLEDPNLKEAGMINGKIISSFYLKNNTPLFYDLDLEYNDTFCNNQFTGEWISYSGSVREKCCWGTFRIPDSGDLDVGAAEFHPNPKYKDYGWEDLIKAYETDSNDDWIKEKNFWWND